MREIVLDTETTGLSYLEGDRIIEIGALELENFLPTGRTYQVYINPQRAVPLSAQKVHGLTDEFLKDKPVFSDIINEFMDFIADDTLIIHNAPFDIGFLNAEIEMCKKYFKPISMDRVTDSLQLAKQQFPRLSNSLDNLCNRFNINKSDRKLHGALIDCHLLAQVYLELKGGRQGGFSVEINQNNQASDSETQHSSKENTVHERVSEKKIIQWASVQEQDEHKNFVKQLGDQSVWKKYKLYQ